MKKFLTLVLFAVSFSAMAQSLSDKSKPELQKMKDDALANEDYGLAKKIKAEMDSRRTLNEYVQDLRKSLDRAVASEQFEKAAQIKKDLKAAEEQQAKIVQLQQQKVAAETQGNIPIATALQNEINILNRAPVVKEEEPEEQKPAVVAQPVVQSVQPAPQPVQQPVQQPEPAQPAPTNTYQGPTKTYNTLAGAITLKENNVDDFSKANIACIGFGFRSGYDDLYGYNYLEDVKPGAFLFEEWVTFAPTSKYASFGIFINISLIDADYIYAATGLQYNLYGDFGSAFVPYTGIGLGLAYDMYSAETFDFETGEYGSGTKIALPLRAGSMLFLNKNRTFGFFTEVTFDPQTTYLPVWRYGFCMGSVKLKHRRLD